MVAVRPFKALMFDFEEVQEGPEQVTSLPYDVMSQKEVERLKKASEHNVTHLTLPSPAPGKEDSSKYQQANKLLKRWRKEGILYQRPSEAFYLYEVTYDDGERKRTASGLACLLGLDPDYEQVRPHERTHKGPIEDRFELLKATAMDLEPIQFLYRDGEGTVMERLRENTKDQQPLLDFTDPNGTHHSLWAVSDRETVDAVESWFADQTVYIADGHHRYATALAYADWRRDQNAADEDEPKRYDHKLAVLMEANDPGLTVKATHRLVRLDDKQAARTRLSQVFGTEPLKVGREAPARAQAIQQALAAGSEKEHRFVFDWGDETCDVVAIPSSEVPGEMAPDQSEAWRALDVSVLHHHVLPKSLGITQENAGQRLAYTRDAVEAVGAALEGEVECSVLMNATPQGAVLEVADVREHMPQKSTYFLPKLQSGLFLSPL